jgi:hypothetical protein
MIFAAATRTSGWELWRTNDGRDGVVVTGEFHGRDPGIRAFAIPGMWFGDELVFDNTKK